MMPPRTRLDPDNYYARLGLEPAATQLEIVAAFRGKARLLHPDVPKTGDAGAFVEVKQAYDVLSNPGRRAAYDRKARQAAQDAVNREMIMERRTAYPAAAGSAGGAAGRPRDIFELPVMLWAGLAVFLCVCVYEAATHLLAPSPIVHDEIPPNAATVAPLSATAHQAVLYGPAPVLLGGVPNFYVTPVSTPAILWRLDVEHSTLLPAVQLPPFSEVQAVRLIRQNGMLEVLWNDHSNAFISADHLTPGSAAAARRAYCGYNAGPTPFDGELLERRGSGQGTLEMENRAMQPAVGKLRDGAGEVALSVFLGPGGHAVLNGVPDGTYHTDFAIGELWSRACNSFAAGMRARRMEAALRVPFDSHLVVAAEAGSTPAADISDQAFERD
jgi:hypothetical protein